ncbi:CDP-alcohol phosphatidyltransferase family protein [Pseudokineococcus sp. 1T1Z-3]|uniref:CDP-alcohol phosphatidyltransferase family protein n=1 Tax=Pseudokineococcus sp. 1T1Z-3 TaxID=3132745 RepID=UPI0030A41610
MDTRPRTSPRESYRDVVARLAAAQKSGRGAPAYSRYVNRRLGRHLAAAAYLTGRTPTQVTAVSAVATGSGIAVLALGPNAWWTGVVVTALLVLGYALDAADGQLARLQGGGTLAGEWLDHVVDSVKISALHLAVLVHLHHVAGPEGALAQAWLLAPLLFTVVAAVSFFAQILNEQLRRAASGSGTSRSSASPLVSLLKAPTDFGVLCGVLLLLGAVQVFAVAYSLLALASAGYLALALGRWYREMRSYDAERAVR